MLLTLNRPTTLRNRQKLFKSVLLLQYAGEKLKQLETLNSTAKRPVLVCIQPHYVKPLSQLQQNLQQVL